MIQDSMDSFKEGWEAACREIIYEIKEQFQDTPFSEEFNTFTLTLKIREIMKESGKYYHDLGGES
jgi:hypothetical protein